MKASVTIKGSLYAVQSQLGVIALMQSDEKTFERDPELSVYVEAMEYILRHIHRALPKCGDAGMICDPDVLFEIAELAAEISEMATAEGSGQQSIVEDMEKDV